MPRDGPSLYPLVCPDAFHSLTKCSLYPEAPTHFQRVSQLFVLTLAPHRAHTAHHMKVRVLLVLVLLVTGVVAPPKRKPTKTPDTTKKNRKLLDKSSRVPVGNAFSGEKLDEFGYGRVTVAGDANDQRRTIQLIAGTRNSCRARNVRKHGWIGREGASGGVIHLICRPQCAKGTETTRWCACVDSNPDRLGRDEGCTGHMDHRDVKICEQLRLFDDKEKYAWLTTDERRDREQEKKGYMETWFGLRVGLTAIQTKPADSTVNTAADGYPSYSAAGAASGQQSTGASGSGGQRDRSTPPPGELRRIRRTRCSSVPPHPQQQQLGPAERRRTRRTRYSSARPQHPTQAERRRIRRRRYSEALPQPQPQPPPPEEPRRIRSAENKIQLSAVAAAAAAAPSRAPTYESGKQDTAHS